MHCNLEKVTEVQIQGIKPPTESESLEVRPRHHYFLKLPRDSGTLPSLRTRGLGQWFSNLSMYESHMEGL